MNSFDKKKTNIDLFTRNNWPELEKFAELNSICPRIVVNSTLQTLLACVYVELGIIMVFKFL